MNWIYEEKQSMHMVFTIINIIVAVILIGQVIYIQEIRDNIISLIILIVIAIFLVFVGFSFYHLKIKISDQQLMFSFGPMKKKFYIKNMSETHIDDYKFKNYGGFGIRKGFDKTTGFVAKKSKGIKFRDNHSNKVYFFTTDNPDQIMSLLIQYGAKKA